MDEGIEARTNLVPVGELWVVWDSWIGISKAGCGESWHPRVSCTTSLACGKHCLGGSGSDLHFYC